MSEEPENLVLRALAQIGEQNDLIPTKLEELTVQVSAVERDLAGKKVDMAAINQRLDNFDRRLVRLERRLDLVDASLV